jgi:hypothetical protein
MYAYGGFFFLQSHVDWCDRSTRGSLAGPHHRVHREWQWPLSGLHSIVMVKSAQLGAGGGARTPPFTLTTITSTIVVYAPAERADTIPLFLLYPYMYSVVPTDTLLIAWISFSLFQGGRARTDFSLAWLEAAWYFSEGGHGPSRSSSVQKMLHGMCITVTHLRFNFLCLLLLYSIYLNGLFPAPVHS